MSDSIKLGDKVQDKITGFIGIATARIEYLHGCVQIEVMPPVDKDNKKPDAIWMDEPRLESIKEKAVNIKRMAMGGPDMSPSDIKRG